jgi:5-carboxymethyl-2-hydroxymuconate isomerase
MPHITVEYSSNIPDRPDTKSFLRTLHETLAGIETFKMQDIKSRIIIHEDFLAADGPKGFIHLQLAIMPREDRLKSESSDRLMAVLQKFFPKARGESHSFSVEIRDLHKDSYRKS